MKVISGGQTGADRAALKVARACGLATGGWMPKGFVAEDGHHPDFVDLYGMQECESDAYPVRTVLNVKDADLTLWFGEGASGGRQTTSFACESSQTPFIDIALPRTDAPPPEDVAARIRQAAVKVLNVAGHRESVQPGIELWTTDYLTQLFALLK